MNHTKRMTSFFLILACMPFLAHARKLEVGPTKSYTMPMQAASVAQDGDTVEIDAGTYTGETATWRANNLVLRSKAAFAKFIIRHCYFHGNENGILGGGGANSNVVVEYSEFADNGFGDGYSHNMYISNIASFTLRYSNSHHAKVGHLVKTRARTNHITYNRIMDEATGNSSYQIDIPDAGTSYIIGNAIQQGPEQDNSTLISFGAESQKNGGTDLYVSGNTLVNDHGSGTFVRAATGTTAKLVNNLFVGPGTILSGTGDTSGNVATTNPGFVNRAGYDYHLTSGSPAVNKAIP